MGGQIAQRDHLGPERDVVAVDLHVLGAGQHGGAARATGLEAREDDRVFGMRTERRDMMQHAPARRHAAACNDDLRLAR